MKIQLEQVTLPGGYSIHAFEYQMETFDAPWHAHDVNELTYIVSSRGLRYVGSQVDNFIQGDFVLLKSKLPHCWKNTDDNTETAQSIVIQWENKLFGVHPEFQQINDLINRAGKGIKFNEHDFTDLKERLMSIVFAEPLKRYVLFVELFQQLCETKHYQYICENSFENELNGKTNQRLDKIFKFIKSNAHRQISLSEVSGLCNMTDESFSRFFSKKLNKSFFTYLNGYRVNLACQQLVDSELPISEIAYSCGFGSVSFFHRQFKKYRKMSSLQYRRIFSKSMAC
jgi:AraC-like DNA-binding protein